MTRILTSAGTWLLTSMIVSGIAWWQLARLLAPLLLMVLR